MIPVSPQYFLTDGLALRVNGAIASMIMDQQVTWIPGAGDRDIPCLTASVLREGRLDPSHGVPVPDYCGDWTQCRAVIDVLGRRGFRFLLRRTPDSLYLGGFWRRGEEVILVEHESPTMAVCLGALMAVGVVF